MCLCAHRRYLVVASLCVVHIVATVAHGTDGALVGGQRVEASAHRVSVHDAAEAAEHSRISGARGGLYVQRHLRAADVVARIALHARVCWIVGRYAMYNTPF